MSPSLDIDIREKLASYLVGEVSLEEFEDWFVPASWNVIQRENRVTIDLVCDISIVLSEYSHGDWSEDELKQLLRPLAADYVEIGYDNIIVMDSVARFELYPLWYVSSGI